MTLASEWQAVYREEIDSELGETITLRRPGSPNIDKTLRARVSGFTPEELNAGINQGKVKVTVLAADVAAQGFPVPFKAGVDSVFVDRDGSTNRKMTINFVDDNTKRAGSTLIAYVLHVEG